MKHCTKSLNKRALGVLSLCTLSALLLASSAGAADTAKTTKLPAGVTFVTDVEGIREYRLKNDLRVLLFPDTSKTTFTLNVTYLVGSRHENYGETGMAHLLEHLVFKGTKTSGNIMEQLSKRGAQFNGTTWFDRTNYFETLTNTGDNLQWAVAMEADRMVNSKISAKDLKTEMTVVRNEFENGENNPFGLLYKQVRSVAFDWHNYGKVTIGNRSDVENVPIEKLQAFYKKYYQPDNAVVTLAGNFDPEKALALINKEFGKIKKPSRKLSKLYTVENPQDGERSVTVRRVGELPFVMTAYHTPSVRHPDSAALSVLNEILTDAPSGRLYKSLVQTKEATQVFGLGDSLNDAGLFMYGVVLGKDNDVKNAEKKLIKTLEDFKTPSEEEIKRVRTRVLTSYEQALTKPENVGVALSEAIGAGDWRLFFQIRNDVEKVTAKDVDRVAKKYFKPTNRTLGFFIPTAKPDRVEVPAAPTAAEALKNFKARKAQAAGETISPEPDILEKRTIRKEIAGAKVAMLPKKTRGNRIEMVIDLKFGNHETTKADRGAANYIPSLLKRGSKNLTRQQLSDKLEAMKTQLEIAGGAEGAQIQLSTDRKNFHEALDLVYKVLREPVFPKSELEEVRKSLIDTLEYQRNQPNQIAFLALSRSLMPKDAKRGDLFYVNTIDENIEDGKSVTLQQVKDFYQNVWNAKNASVGIVGDFDVKDFEKRLPKILKGFESKTEYKHIVKPLTTPKGSRQKINVPDKANAIYLSGLRFALRDDHKDYVPLSVAMKIFGGGTDSRLFDRIRQKEGLSYGTGASLNVSSKDKRGSFTSYAIYNPKVADKLAEIMQEELQKVIKDGFTKQEVEDAQKSILSSNRIYRSDDKNLSSSLSTQSDLKRTFKYSADIEKQLKSVTPAQAKAAFIKYIKPENIVVVQAGTFEGTSKDKSAPKNTDGKSKSDK